VILYIDGRQTPRCDACGDVFRPAELPPADNSDHAVREMAKDAGWLERPRVRETSSTWEHACPACQREPAPEPDPLELSFDAAVKGRHGCDPRDGGDIAGGRIEPDSDDRPLGRGF
jgi:hypothetical protein